MTANNEGGLVENLRVKAGSCRLTSKNGTWGGMKTKRMGMGMGMADR